MVKHGDLFKFLMTLLSLWSIMIGLVSTGQVDYTDCGSKANITELRVTGCTEPPCILYKGQSYEIEIDAISSSASTKLPYKVTVKVIFPITLLKGNACDVLSKGSCPVKPGDEFTYKNTIAVERDYPSLHSKVTAKVLDDKNNVLICILLDVEITSKSKKSNEYWTNVLRKLRQSGIDLAQY